jgi:hypothetical protein
MVLEVRAIRHYCTVHRISSTLSISRTPARVCDEVRVELIFLVFGAIWKFYTNDVDDVARVLQTPMFVRPALPLECCDTVHARTPPTENEQCFRNRRAFERNA